jgi:hypothetical protein
MVTKGNHGRENRRVVKESPHRTEPKIPTFYREGTTIAKWTEKLTASITCIPEGKTVKKFLEVSVLRAIA